MRFGWRWRTVRSVQNEVQHWAEGQVFAYARVRVEDPIWNKVWSQVWNWAWDSVWGRVRQGVKDHA